MSFTKIKNDGSLALFLGFVFGLIGVDRIITEGKIPSSDPVYFLENNYGYLFMVFAGFFLMFGYLDKYSASITRLLKEKDWTNIFYPLWILSVVSPTVKYNTSIYIKVLPILIPAITIYVLLKFHSKLTSKSIKEYMSELFAAGKTNS